VVCVFIFCGRVQLMVKDVVLPETLGLENLQSWSGICASWPSLVGSLTMSGVMHTCCFIGMPDMENSHKPGRICAPCAATAADVNEADSRTNARANDMDTP